MRFIIMLRNPTDQAWPYWRMNIPRDLDTLPFATAIREGRTRVLEDGEHAGLARHSRDIRHSRYIERGCFGRQVASLATLLPLSNMLFLRQADLLRDPDAALAQVPAFLDVTPDGAEMAAEDADYLDALFHDHLERLTGVRLERE